jgi:hypothetical protein
MTSGMRSSPLRWTRASRFTKFRTRPVIQNPERPGSTTEPEGDLRDTQPSSWQICSLPRRKKRRRHIAISGTILGEVRRAIHAAKFGDPWPERRFAGDPVVGDLHEQTTARHARCSTYDQAGEGGWRRVQP